MTLLKHPFMLNLSEHTLNFMALFKTWEFTFIYATLKRCVLAVLNKIHFQIYFSSNKKNADSLNITSLARIHR